MSRRAASRVLIAAIALVSTAVRVRAAGPSSNRSADDPCEFVRAWWYHGVEMPPANSEPVRHLIEYYGQHPDDARVIHWVAVAQASGVLKTNHSTFDLVKLAAEKGEPAAMARLGMALVEGVPPPGDVKRGMGLLESADAKGDPDAALDLGQIYLSGTGGVTRDLARAEQYLRRALAAGHVRAHFAMFELYNRRKDAPQVVLEELRAGADGGDEQAMEALAEIYRSGASAIAPDPKMALKYFERAALRGYPPAQIQIAKGILTGFAGLEKSDSNFKTARSLLTKAAASNDREGMRLLARTYLTRELGSELDPPKAVELLKRAAALKDAEAMNDLAELYIEGFVVPRDLERARELTERAAALGSAGAKSRLPRMRRAMASSTRPAGGRESD